MHIDEYFLMKPKFLASYLKSRKELEEKEFDTSKVAVKDLDAQYEQVFSVKSDSATINITGPLTEDGPDAYDIQRGYGGTAYANIRRALKEAADTTTGPIYLNINSPGGGVVGIDETYAVIKEVAKDREVVAINSGLIASAAIWLAAGATRIEARVETAMIGSIGVAVSVADFSGYYAFFGIEVVTLTNEASKDKRPDVKTDYGKQVIVEELNQIYSVFEKRVIDFGVSKENIRALKGAVVIADKAIALGFMNGYLGKGDKPITSKPMGVESKAEDSDTNIKKEETIKMDLAKLKAEYPELYTSVVAEGTEAERSRCLTFVSCIKELPECSSVYEDAIKAGKGINDASVHAAVMSATKEASNVKAAEDDSAAPIKTEDKKLEEADADKDLMNDKSLDAMRAELPC